MIIIRYICNSPQIKYLVPSFVVSVGAFLIYNIMKLHANELRIGNLVEYRITDKLDERKEWWEVSEIDADDIHWLSKVDTKDDDFRAIKLKEEWLLNFEFEKYEFDHKDNQYRFKDRLLVIREGLFCDYGTSVVIKTVHQLQNLYFALTGTELTLIK